ncbi:thymidylate synthase [Vibrio phage JSF12]|uniref:thymidylate synthase n=2 Tax=Jesfedecavirus TaxID=2560156 RepID=A0A2D0Z634_9CAUD|nr:thymidylate synthase [Vibrio phage JSF10]YP_009794718.1 thymidylate synthase [Vibrio phage JSF12]ASV43395.1 thymidylate synthase [Vibrio phage JSF10]ASV43553.1 thymidylate synthase [Vibrio phage JSF12]
MDYEYKQLLRHILENGEWVYNERTGKRCLTVINYDLEYNVGAGEFPLLSLRKSFWKSAVAELLGYIRGYSNAEDFRNLGTKTWDANANINEAWLKNPHRRGEDDMGRVYGVQGRNWTSPDGYGGLRSVDQLEKIINNLSKGIDDRGEILNYWNPGEFDQGCLRPCMYNFQFSILNGKLYLNATQRSCDVPLGLNFNMVQVYAFLAIVAQITGLEPGRAFHKIVNAHIYEDQIPAVMEMLDREERQPPTFWIDPAIESLEDLETWVTTSNFLVTDYFPQEHIDIPFSV